jgi:DNA invertase Pin-like site-specific DNA recombinase
MSAALSFTPDPIRCVVYLRISRDDIKKGRGVNRQLERCRLMLPKGWVIVAVVDENDTSATKAKPRPKYEAMLTEIRAKEYDAVMAYAQDRLTRKSIEAEALLALVDSHGVRVATSAAGELRGLRKGTPDFDPDARAAFRNSTVGATREIEWIGKRVTDECAQRARDGRPHGPVGFGWKREHERDADGVMISRDVIDEAEAELIRSAANDVLNGVSLRSVTQRIEAGSLRPRRGAHWSGTTVRLLLLRPSNAGLRQHQGKVLDLEPMGPAILSITDHQRLVSLFNDPSRKSPNRGSAPRWLLSGIAVCGRCGNTKVNVGNGGQRRQRPAYVCARRNGESPGCYARSWVDQVDDYVAAMIEARLADPKLGEPSADVADRINELHQLNAALRAEQDELAGSDLPLSMLKIRGAKLEAQITANDAKISGLLPSVAQRFDVPWDEAELGQRRAMIESLTTRIELHPSGNGRYRQRITPDQVRITWR